MSNAFFSRLIALLLLLAFVVPVSFLVAPQRTSAQSLMGCLGGLIGGVAGGASGGTSAAGTATAVPVNSVAANTALASGNAINGNTSASTYASCINTFVITPLIRAAIRALIQKLTASVITWINGGNGTGQPSYVQNLPNNLQNVGDNQALAFLNQFRSNSNSPFAAAITSSLATNYLQNTSNAGFFAANQDTLVNVTGSQANETSYLNGNWQQGGISAWFALTTQPQNNPYALYQNSQNQLASGVTGAQNTQLSQLSWANGFLSWCGPQVQGSNTRVGTAPGNTCQNSNGTPGSIQTPGTVIAGYANQALVQNGFQQLISASDLDSALNAIVSALLNQVLGGVGGLFGASQNTSNNANGSLTSQLQNYSTGSNASVSTTLQTALTQTAEYSTSWQTIAAAANAASTAATSLGNYCAAEAGTPGASATFIAAANAEATAAQTAITNEIAPVLAQANSASTVAATSQTMIQKVENDQTSGVNPAADLQTLSTMPPSTTDVNNALQNAQQSGAGATAAPAGSLTVSGGTTVDEMDLIATNAATLKSSVCTPPPPTPAP
jgi:hypothetical protein